MDTYLLSHLRLGVFLANWADMPHFRHLQNIDNLFKRADLKR